MLHNIFNLNVFQFNILITGYAEFMNATIQVYENDSFVEVCIRARGYGFVVNVSTVELTAIGMLAKVQYCTDN